MRNDLTLDENSLPMLEEVGLLDRAKSFFQRLLAIWRAKSAQSKLLLFCSFLIAVVILFLGLRYTGKDSSNQSADIQLQNRGDDTVLVEDPAEPKIQQSLLTGVKITQSKYEKQIQRLPLAVVIENHPKARPQTGLSQADLIFETLVEGGITRFVAVYYSRQPEVVGPVRSLRKYFLDLIGGLGDPMIMHIGWAQSNNPEADAIGALRRYGMKSFGVEPGNFWRVSYRRAPHNAYVSTQELWNKAKQKGWVGSSALKNFESWKFKEPSSRLTTAKIETIQLEWNGWGDTLWSVTWKFDKRENLYKRFHKIKKPRKHMDAINEKQLSAKNVVVVYTPMRSAVDGTSRVVYDVVGEGEALVFRDGEEIKARWQKPSRTDRYKFVNESGKEVELNRGQTWVMLAPSNSKLTTK